MNEMPFFRAGSGFEPASTTPTSNPKSPPQSGHSPLDADTRGESQYEVVGEDRPRLRREKEAESAPASDRNNPPVFPGMQTRVIPKLPRRRRTGYGTVLSFLCLVVLPVGAATAYFGFLASNQYVSEFHFTVQDTSASSAPTATNPIVTALGGAGAGASSQNYVVVDYLKSRQAIDELESRVNVRAMYARPDIDWFYRLPTSKPMESFVRYWDRIVAADFDQLTGLATVKIRAFSPADAKQIADTLVTLSEELINRIAMRTNTDAVRFAEAEVVRQQSYLEKVRTRLLDFRNKAGVIDANASIGASNSTLSQSLRANLAQLETNLATLMKQNLPANASSVLYLKSQINATKDQIRTVEALVGKNLDGKPLSTLVGEYEQLDMERQFAQTMVTGAMQALDAARQTASSQHLYITPYVRPALPESATYPHRWTSIFLFAAAAIVIWTLLTLIVRSVREHYT